MVFPNFDSFLSLPSLKPALAHFSANTMWILISVLAHMKKQFTLEQYSAYYRIV